MMIALSDIYAGRGERALPAIGFALMIGAVFVGVNSRAARKDGSWGRAALAALLALGGSVLRRRRLRPRGAERAILRLAVDAGAAADPAGGALRLRLDGGADPGGPRR